jgi:alpha-L-arabinofuranosidase
VAELFSLHADSLQAENSFADPVRYVPRHSAVSGVKPAFETVFQPFSISVLRIKDKNRKKVISK